MFGGNPKDKHPPKPAQFGDGGAAKKPVNPARAAMAQRVREDRDPKMRDFSGFDDGLGPARRRSMDASLNIVGALDPASMAKTLAADVAFARIEQLRGGHGLLTAVGVMNGSTMKGMGQRLNGPTLGQPKDADVLSLRAALRQANPKAALEVFKAIAEHAEGQPKQLLSSTEFCELVIKLNKAADLFAACKASAWKVVMEKFAADARLKPFITETRGNA